MKKKSDLRKEKIAELQAAGFKYISRAQHGEVVAHKKKPKRELNYWSSKGEHLSIGYADLFHELQWHDDPLYIGKEV